MTADGGDTIRMPEAWPWLFRVAGPAIGFGVGFAVAPLVRWSVDLVGGAPGPLRILASLPTAWTVAVTTVLGLVLGIWVATAARRESLAVTVDGTHARLVQNGDELYVPRERVATVRRDGADLVLLDARSAELARNKASDLSWTRLREAFTRHGYAWESTSDSDGRFRRWVDGHPDLDDAAHDLLRARARALTDKRVGAAAELREQLQKHDVVVRDRGGAQEYRPIVEGA